MVIFHSYVTVYQRVVVIFYGDVITNKHNKPTIDMEDILRFSRFLGATFCSSSASADSSCLWRAPDRATHGLKHMPERMLEYLPKRPKKKPLGECQNRCQIECQNEFQNKWQIECHNRCQAAKQKCQSRCQIE